MTVGLLIESDEKVAAWLFARYNQPSLKYDRALGLVNGKEIVGAILLHNWNGFNVEVSYYGANTMRAGIIKSLARLGVHWFNPARCTVVVSKKNRRLMKSLSRFGFKIEGVQRCYYGHEDTVRNTGVRFVIFKDRINELAKLPTQGTPHNANGATP